MQESNVAPCGGFHCLRLVMGCVLQMYRDGLKVGVLGFVSCGQDHATWGPHFSTALYLPRELVGRRGAGDEGALVAAVQVDLLGEVLVGDERALYLLRNRGVRGQDQSKHGELPTTKEHRNFEKKLNPWTILRFM